MKAYRKSRDITPGIKNQMAGAYPKNGPSKTS